ncbi:MAG: hypothetical protein HYW01_00040 [Deltaproteobacteria bacterium]|nr:hypothetical protein [Deltaproteobacteria bacterium]
MKKLFFFVYGLLIICFPHTTYSHQIKGEITPLLNRMEIILRLIEGGKTEVAFKETQGILDDFHYHRPAGVEEGLRTTVARIDKKYGTDLEKPLNESIMKKDPAALKKSLQTLGVLLMLEKFQVLEETFDKNDTNIDAQRTIFWLGRNYFSLLLEPTLARYEPAEELKTERLLDRMLYRLEDKKWNEFRTTKVELINQIQKYFKLSLPDSILAGFADN